MAGRHPASSMEGAEPLIVSSKAARRLRLLLPRGVPPPAGGGGAQAGAAPTALEAAARSGALAAALLDEPVQAQAPSGEAWQGSRDPQSEVAVTLRTLQALQASRCRRHAPLALVVVSGGPPAAGAGDDRAPASPPLPALLPARSSPLAP